MPQLTAAKALWTSLGLPLHAFGEQSALRLSPNADRVINSSFKLGDAAQISIGLSAFSAAYYQKLNTGISQNVSVDARHAAIQFHSEVYYTLQGKPPPPVWDAIAGLYRTQDGHVRIHTNFPHHRRGILDILKIPDTPQVNRAIVQEHLLGWSAVDFETEAAARNMCATALRTHPQWEAHPQAKETPPVQLFKIGEAPTRKEAVDKILERSHALNGIRVLDLTRVIAGPVAGRTLAAHGADVLLITSRKLPALPALDADTSRGKRTAQLDLDDAADRQALANLASECDVFLQAYRPGSLEAKGFGPAQLAAARPGIVYASLSAWGSEGPWKGRRGFDSLVQTATGYNVDEGEAYASAHGNADFTPRPLPVQALDHAAGYLLAFGINAALAKTITEGGSWEVRVSLAGVGQWIRSLGRLSPEDAFLRAAPLPAAALPQDSEIQAVSESWHDDEGQPVMTAIKHSADMERTPVIQGGYAPVTLDASHPAWK